VGYLLGGDRGCLSGLTWTISIWLGTYGDLEPNDGAGKTGELIATTEIAGIAFDVIYINDPLGSAFNMWVFQAQENQGSFDGDIMDFIRWTAENDGAQIGCLWSVQGGLDIYGGTGSTFTTTQFSAKQLLRSGSTSGSLPPAEESVGSAAKVSRLGHGYA
jgi:hypothetical protein